MPPGARPKVEHAIKIEHHHEPVVEPMNAGRGLREPAFEVDRIFLPAAGRQFQDFADGIDQQPVGFAIVLDADGKRTPAVAGRPESKPAPHVDHRQDAPTHVEEARHLGWGKRYPGQTIRNEHVLYPRNRQAEQLAADRCGDVFHEGFHRDHALRAHLASAACALSAASRPQRSSLATQSRSPTLLPRSMASGESMDDNPTIGSCAVDGFARNADARSKPSIPGISMSVITNWKRSPDSRTASASPAEAAVVTAYPAALTTGASMLRKNGESSIRSARRSALSSPGSLRLRQSPKASGRKCPMSMISVACPFITADPSKPAVSLISSTSRRSCTISTISSTTSPMARCSSENTSRACVPLLLIIASGAAGTSGMSWPRYVRPAAHSDARWSWRRSLPAASQGRAEPLSDWAIRRGKQAWIPSLSARAATPARAAAAITWSAVSRPRGRPRLGPESGSPSRRPGWYCRRTPKSGEACWTSASRQFPQYRKRRRRGARNSGCRPASRRRSRGRPLAPGRLRSRAAPAARPAAAACCATAAPRCP